MGRMINANTIISATVFAVRQNCPTPEAVAVSAMIMIFF
jgi:hypothetical protein